MITNSSLKNLSPYYALKAGPFSMNKFARLIYSGAMTTTSLAIMHEIIEYTGGDNSHATSFVIRQAF